MDEPLTIAGNNIPAGLADLIALDLLNDPDRIDLARAVVRALDPRDRDIAGNATSVQ
jgi:hypothetical protein